LGSSLAALALLASWPLRTTLTTLGQRYSSNFLGHQPIEHFQIDLFSIPSWRAHRASCSCWPFWPRIAALAADHTSRERRAVGHDDEQLVADTLRLGDRATRLTLRAPLWRWETGQDALDDLGGVDILPRQPSLALRPWERFWNAPGNRLLDHALDEIRVGIPAGLARFARRTAFGCRQLRDLFKDHLANDAKIDARTIPTGLTRFATFWRRQHPEHLLDDSLWVDVLPTLTLRTWLTALG
jgi:hypothetical protein